MMKILQPLLLLSLSYLACALQCKEPKPIDNFVLKDFLGNWKTVAYELLHPQDQLLYAISKCGGVNFTQDANGKYKWNFNVVIGPLSTQFMGGTFTIPDSKKGFLSMPTSLGLTTYNFTVMCTDYTTYAATYACGEILPGFLSEWVLLFLKNPDDYDKVILKSELDGCYLDFPNKSVLKLTRRSQEHCSLSENGIVKSVLDLIGGILGGLLKRLF